MPRLSRKKSPLRATRLAERKRKVRNVKIVFFSIIFLLVISGFVWLVHVPALSLTSIAITGNSAVDTADVKKIVADDLNGSYWYIIPKHNRLFYPKAKITADILATFSRFKSVSVKASGTTLSISAVERDPSYVWCTGTPATDADNDCYFIDARSYIFSEAPVISGNAYFHFYGYVSNTSTSTVSMTSTTTPIGLYYMPEAMFKSLDKFITSLSTLGIKSFALQVEPNGVYNLYLLNGGRLLFDTTDNMNELLVTIGTIARQTAIFTHGPDLDYVDFRYGNKVYYKLIGDNAAHE